MINRPKYLQQIAPFVDKPIIKVITGMRRVGKSTLLENIKEYFLKDVPESNIIHLNFESLEFISIKDASDLSHYLIERMDGITGKLYFFLDEIQLIENWERVVNALRVDRECDIYLTGSNSTLLSGDLASLLAGRYITVEVQPFTFVEFTELFKDQVSDKAELFNHYLRLGGMPFLQYFDLEEDASYTYLNDVYNTVLVKDVIEYNSIRDVEVFNRILTFAMENIGHTFSANSIRKYFRSEKINISVDTILNYLEYCGQAYIINKIPRYNTLGKELLKVDEKYYLTDHGFRQARGFSNIRDIERTLENIICIELKSRGYQLQIGKVGNKEIDFIATKDNRVEYFQISYLLESESTREREFGVYKDINDNYPKYVLSMDTLDFSQDGIVHKNLIDFLLEVNE
ncbi:ATP-binding protein [Aerococcaceae bacterium DSM 111176]|nr:ATP-binding protein [Aerococcaceae bacterium DSM 111176]